jgi:hypothetical protein
VIDPVQPTRSAITVAGMSGVVVNRCRTNDSNGVNDVGTAGRSYFGGPSEANARSTVDLPIPRSRATLTLRNTVGHQPPNQSPILH